MLTYLPGFLINLPAKAKLNIQIEKCETSGLRFIAGSCSISGVNKKE